MTVPEAITELVQFINRVEEGPGEEADDGTELAAAPTDGEIAAMWRLIGLGRSAMAWTAMTEEEADELESRGIDATANPDVRLARRSIAGFRLGDTT